MTLETRIKQAAHSLGFDYAAIALFQPPPFIEQFNHWLQSGSAGEMRWIERDSEKRKNPQLVFPPGKSILIVGLNYYQPDFPGQNRDDPSRGQIAMYAWGKDYHDLIIPRLKSLAQTISSLAGTEVNARWFADTGPILEKPFAASSYIGFIGKNTLLIHQKRGSFLFLGELLLDLELEPDLAPPEPLLGCGSCAACVKRCPTFALDAPYKLNTTRCISYLTIEHSGVIPRELRPLMGNWIYGCDECQTVCPYNVGTKQIETQEAWFRQKDLDFISPSLLDLITLEDAGFNKRFRGSPILRIKRSGLLRNVAIALGNWGSEEALAGLVHALNDHEPLIRLHAAGALGQLNSTAARRQLDIARNRESNSEVLQEIKASSSS